jgi:uncharacterized protein (DUF1919 family)
MWLNDRDFNRCVGNLQYYLSLPLEFERIEYKKDQKKGYPVGKLDDILLHFNHYPDFESAKECWENRKKRVNYNNILVVSSTMSRENAEDFEKLPYENKIVFTPFNNGLQSNVYIKYEDNHDGTTIGMMSNEAVGGTLNVLNLLDLLSHKKDYFRND